MQGRLQKRDIVIKAVLSLIGLNGAFFAAYFIAFGDLFYTNAPASRSSYILLLINANLLFLVINLFQTHGIERAYRNFALFVIGYMAVIILIRGYELSRLFHVIFLTLLFVITTFLKYSNFVQLLGKYLFPYILEQRVILIGDELDASIVNYIDSRPGNHKCVGLLSDQTPRQSEIAKLHLGGVDKLERVLSDSLVDEILISTSLLSVEKVDWVIKTARAYHATASILPPYFRFLSDQTYRTEGWMGVPIISIYHSKLAVRSHRIAKRAMDIAVSLFFLLAIFPVLYLIVAPAIWITTRGPIFFKQLRKGYKQKPFFCYKFRTMKSDAGVDQSVQARRHDPRTTIVGESLRKSSIDEVPQFWNVLSGNMSVVGPRPHMVEHDELFEKHIDKYNVRFVTKPGITGWAQVNGLRGSVEGNPELLEKRIEHDLWYIKNWSLWLDVKIIYMTTVKVLIKGDRNAY